MNADILHLFQQYLLEANSPTAAAILTLAEVLSHTDTDGTVSVQEAARRLGTSSKNVYQMCINGQMRCARAGGRVRIALDEIKNHLGENL